MGRIDSGLLCVVCRKRSGVAHSSGRPDRFAN
jgi:hypothetical protein